MTSSQNGILFISQKLTHFSDFQRELLSELQLMGRYHWVKKNIDFTDESLAARFEQVKPIAEAADCNTAVWIDETSTHQSLIQFLALAPGRMALRSIEVDERSQRPADTAIVIDEMLRQSDADHLSEPKGEEEQTASDDENTTVNNPSPAATAVYQTPERHYFLFAGGNADVATYSPFTLLPGGLLEGCLQTKTGLGGCLSIQAAGQRNRRVSDVDITQFQLRPGLSLFFSKRFSHWAFGPALGFRPIWQYVSTAPENAPAEHESYFNSSTEITGWVHVYWGTRFVLQFRIGAMAWLRTLEFNLQSSAESLFRTPRFSPMGAILLGAVF